MVTWIWLGALIVMFGALHRRLADAARADADRRAPATPPASAATCASTFLLEIGLIVVIVAARRCCSSRVRCAQRGRATDETLEAERAELEALKEAKYREIRDAELDYRTGKLSEADWQVLDRTLRPRRSRSQAVGSSTSRYPRRPPWSTTFSASSRSSSPSG